MARRWPTRSIIEASSIAHLAWRHIVRLRRGFPHRECKRSLQLELSCKGLHHHPSIRPSFDRIFSRSRPAPRPIHAFGTVWPLVRRRRWTSNHTLVACSGKITYHIFFEEPRRPSIIPPGCHVGESDPRGIRISRRSAMLTPSPTAETARPFETRVYRHFSLRWRYRDV